LACFRTNPKDVPVDSLFAGNFEQRGVRRRLPPPPPTLPRTNRAWRTCHCAGLSGVYGAFLKRPLPVFVSLSGDTWGVFRECLCRPVSCDISPPALLLVRRTGSPGCRAVRTSRGEVQGLCADAGPSGGPAGALLGWPPRCRARARPGKDSADCTRPQSLSFGDLGHGLCATLHQIVNPAPRIGDERDEFGIPPRYRGVRLKEDRAVASVSTQRHRHRRSKDRS